VKWHEALVSGDITTANAFVGEVTGLINTVEPAADILEHLIQTACRQLQSAEDFLN